MASVTLQPLPSGPRLVIETTNQGVFVSIGREKPLSFSFKSNDSDHRFPSESSVGFLLNSLSTCAKAEAREFYGYHPAQDRQTGETPFPKKALSKEFILEAASGCTHITIGSNPEQEATIKIRQNEKMEAMVIPRPDRLNQDVNLTDAGRLAYLHDTVALMLLAR